MIQRAYIEENIDDLLAGMPVEAARYYDDLSDLIYQAQTGEIDQNTFQQQAETLTVALLLLLYLRGSGKTEAQLTSADRSRINQQARAMLGQLPTLGSAVYAGDFQPVEEGGRGHSIPARVFTWASIAAGIWWLGQIFSGPDYELLEWRYSIFKDHCDQCRNLNGQIKTRKEWRRLASEQGIYPGSWYLECHGIHCGCELVPVAGQVERSIFVNYPWVQHARK